MNNHLKIESKVFLFLVVFFWAPFFSNQLLAQVPDLVGGPLGIERVASHVKIPENGYISPELGTADTIAWLQIDLGKSLPIEQIKLFPEVSNNGWQGKPNSRSLFPVRFRIETAQDGDESFRSAKIFFDHTNEDCDGSIAHKVESFSSPGRTSTARYVRLAITKFPKTGQGKRMFRLWRVEVISEGKDVAEKGRLSHSFSGELPKQDFLRPRRMDGEFAHYDHPENVTLKASWNQVAPALKTPRSGVEIGGFFGKLQERNEQYLLHGFTASDLARDFRERAGKPVPLKRDYRPDDNSPWLRVLGGSNAGRFLMGAGNQLRWKENSELRRKMDEVVDAIDECAEADGYTYGFPERKILEGGEEGAYARSWLTMGLIEAGIAKNPKAFQVARRANDWFNHSPYLPEMLYHASFGVQGMIPSTRIYVDTNIGKVEDIQVVQRYMQQNNWLAQLTSRDPAAINQYPYDRPHCYLINPLNAYMDMYYATGDKLYLNAVTGGWEIYHTNFEHVGGSIAICEHDWYPAKSYRLRQHTGELCGSVFWTFLNQQFRLLYPEEEKYTAEIEKGIYNVGAANQCENGDILYHAHLIAPKRSHEEECRNTCCEGQGTRLLGALPEFIYKISDDGIYVDLFNESEIIWEQGGGKLKLAQHTAFPYDPEVKMQFLMEKPVKAKIRVRVPGWAAKPMDIFINGKKQAAGDPGTYITLTRTWKDKDEIGFTLPMSFRLTKYAGIEEGFWGKEAYALEYGPILMAVVGKSVQRNGVANILLTEKELPGKLIPVTGQPLHFMINDRGEDKMLYMPYYEVKGELRDAFTCYPILKK